MSAQVRSTSTASPTFSFGIVSDIQYADCDDGATFDGSTVRRHRQSLRTFLKACEDFQSHDIKCCVQLGDILDGKCRSMGIVRKCLSDVLAFSRQVEAEWYFCFGNHDFMVMDRRELFERLVPQGVRRECSPEKLYYSFTPQPGCRFIFLDPYEISTLCAGNSQYFSIAEELLKRKNPNLSVPNGDWFAGLEDKDKRFVPYNGGMSTTQFEWLRGVLQAAAASGERVFVFSHMPCYQGCVRVNGLIWNAEQLQKILAFHRGTVVAFFAGHDHDGGYAVDDAGIHHIIPPAPLECAVDELAYGHITVDLRNECFTIHWTGRTPKDTTRFPHWPAGVALRFPSY
jgi:manganese-dependent ADP-ribose/CDP-alcohol diphosphatase